MPPRIKPKNWDPLKDGFHAGTRVFDTFDCTWVTTYDLWYHAIVKHTSKRDFTTEHIATFETLDDWETNFKADGTVAVSYTHLTLPTKRIV